MIHYELVNADGKVLKKYTGTELREKFGLDASNPIFTSQLVHKFNLMMECNGAPERMRTVAPETLSTGD